MREMIALTQEQISNKAPQVYTKAPHGAVSQKYSFLPTYQIIEDMEKLGWLVSDAKTAKSKNDDQLAYGKHMVKFFNPAITLLDSEGGIEAYPEILIMNNHRGWGQFRFEIGVFRLICENGLIIKDKDLGQFNLRHFGYSFAELQRLVNQAIEVLPNVVQKINILSNKIMSENEITAFATAAIKARFGEEKLVHPEEIMEVISTSRDADNGSTLWVVFNRIQEKVIRGGFTLIDGNNKQRQARKIVNMLEDVKLNQKLWELTAEFV